MFRAYKIVVSFVLLVLSVTIQAQYASEEELKEAANKMFEEKKYAEAMPLFSQLLSLYSKDANYNYKYGACILYASEEKDNALQYLSFAVTKPNVDPLAYYFLAKSHHRSYQFSKAENNYNKFKEKTKPKEHKAYNIDREIRMCENGEKLLSGITDIGVLSKKDIKETDFFRSYDLKGIGGKIVVKPDEFRTKYDKKNDESSLIYIGEPKDIIVFSSYGEDGAQGKNLFKVVKLPSGEWSEPSTLGDKVNSEEDEDYPFIHPDGKTLYFSSKGYNSMGGYDVFKSTLDPTTGQWSYPENMDFPINTPDDDILYISDIDNRLAYFASSRSSKKGELTVYNVTVEAPPAENSIIKGFFLAESNPNMKSATITIQDTEGNRKYGVFTTKNESGEYLLVFPKNGGKYKILVETTNDAPIHSAEIEIPKLEDLRALKQELRLVGTGSDEKLVVKNLFDESDEFSINDPLIVQNLIRQKANLDVNTTEEELNNKSVEKVEDKPTSPYADLSDEDLISDADEKAEKIEEQAKESRKQANNSYQIALEKSNEAKEKYGEYEALMGEAESASPGMDKTEKVSLAEQKKLEAAQLINESVAALNVARLIDGESVERESDIQLVQSMQEKINNSINSGNRDEANLFMEELDEITSATYHNQSALASEEQAMDEKLEEEGRKYKKAKDRVTELQNRDYDLAETINKLEKLKGETKKKSEKEDLEARIQAVKIDLEDNRFDLDNAKKKVAKVEQEFIKVNNEVGVSKTVLADLNEKDDVSDPISEEDKLKIENDINYFKKQGLVGLYPTDKDLLVLDDKVSEPYSLEEHKDEYTIVNESGDLIDYNTQYSVELTKVDGVENPVEKALLVEKINENWIKSIDEEIDIRKKQLEGETSNLGKEVLAEKINSLETLRSEKQSEIDANAQLAKSENGKPKQDEVSISKVEEVNIMNPDGTLIDYNTKYNDKLTEIGDGDGYEDYSQKAGVYTNWVSATAQELLLKKIELSEANEEEKNNIENEIAVLQNNMDEQKEFIQFYNELANAAKVDGVSSDDTTSAALALTKISEGEQTTPIEDYEAKYAAEIDAIVAQNPYDANTLKANIYKNWAKDIESDLERKKAELAQTSDEAKKKELENQIAVLENKLTEQNEYANLYAANEQGGDESSVNVDEEQTSPSDESSTVLAQVNEVDPGEDYNEFYGAQLSSISEDHVDKNSKKAQIHKNWAEKIRNDISAKEDQLILADEDGKRVLNDEITTLNNKLSEQEQFAELFESQVLASVPLELTTSNTSEESNASNEVNTDGSVNKVEPLGLGDYSTEYDKTYEGELETIAGDDYDTYIRRATVYDNWVKDTKGRLEEKNALLENAEDSEKQSLANEIEILKLRAAEREQLAMSFRKQAESLKPSAPTGETLAESTPKDLSEDERQLVMSLDPQEINSIRNSEEYRDYSGLQQERRRLIKEAEVEYVRADSLEKELKEKRQLVFNMESKIDSIESEEEKTEELAKIDKLKDDINKDDTKISELRFSASDKENRANELDNQSNFILANADTKLARNYAALERFDEFENGFISDIFAEPAEEGITESNTALVDVATSDNTDSSSNEETLIAIEQPETETIESVDTAAISVVPEVLPEDSVSIIEGVLVDVPDSTEKLVSDREEVITSNEPDTSKVLASIADNEVQLSIDTAATAEVVKSKPVEVSMPKEDTTNTQLLASEVNGDSNDTSSDLTDEVSTDNTPSEVRVETVEDNTGEVNQEPEETEGGEEANLTTEVVENNEPPIESPTKVSGKPDDNIYQIPEVLDNSIFVINSNQPAYNENRKIPVSPKLPSGLVFKVQIGAFRNPIPQDHFKGFAPIMAENAGNVTRYTAGLFKGFDSANEAKNSIRSLGYSDAFVVAFLNGKRIGINEARAMLAGGGGDVFAVNSTTNNQQNTGQSESNKTSSTTEEVRDGISTDVRNIDGTYYSIQVGVYSNPLRSGQLSNISPLNSERTSSGLIRYMTGIYKSLDVANDNKDRVRGLGIPDAFIVAYNDGKRIRINDATGLLGVSNNKVEENSSESNTGQNESVREEVEETTIELPEEKEVTSIDASKIEFRVKLGEYQEDIPTEEATFFLQLISMDVKSYKKGSSTIYTAGSFSNYNQATDLKSRIDEMGSKKFEIIALSEGEEVNLQEAIELLKGE